MGVGSMQFLAMKVQVKKLKLEIGLTRYSRRGYKIREECCNRTVQFD